MQKNKNQEEYSRKKQKFFAAETNGREYIPVSKISIIVPVYNAEKFLGRCLESVLAQSYKNFEVICIDDGSIDNSLKILYELAQKDSRIKIFSQKNQGSSSARNSGLQKISGKYVCFIDSDDYLEPDFLADLYYEAYERTADVVMTATKYIKGQKIKKDKINTQICTSFNEKVKALPHGGACNKIYKAELLQKNNLTFPEGLYWEDNLFTIMACYYAEKMSVINGAEYNYVNNPESNIHNIEKIQKRKDDCLIIARKIVDFADEKHLSVKDKECLIDFCFRSFICAKDLLSQTYAQNLSDIFSHSPYLRKLRRKQIFKHFIKKIFCFLKNKRKVN